MQIHKYIKFPKNYRAVDSKVSGGAQILSPFKMYKLKKNGFTDIVDLTCDSKFKRIIEKLECKIFNIKYTNVETSFNKEGLPLVEIFTNIGNVLANNKKTYVHCKHGKHRTGLCLLVYEKLFTTHNDKEIVKNIDKFWEARVKLKSLYDRFIDQFNIKQSC